MSDPGDQLKRELGDDQDAMDIDDAPSSADTLAPLKSEPKPKDDLEHMFDDEDDDDMEAEVERNGWTSKNNVVYAYNPSSNSCIPKRNTKTKRLKLIASNFLEDQIPLNRGKLTNTSCWSSTGDSSLGDIYFDG